MQNNKNIHIGFLYRILNYRLLFIYFLIQTYNNVFPI